MRSRWLALLFVSVVACADVGTDDDFVTDDVSETSVDDAKADQADLPFTVVDGLTLRTSIGKTEEGRVIRSASAFKTAFGTTPPASIDFSRDWLAVYSAGVKSTGGYTAEILHVRLSDSGKSVKVTSKLTSPGADCIVTQALTKPVAIVKFAKQTGANTARFTKLAATKSCGAVCGAELQSTLADAVLNMTYMSESDYPLTVVSYEGQGAPTVAKIRQLTGTPSTTLVEQRSFADLMDRLGEVYDPADPYAVEYAARWNALRAVLEENLTDLTVIRVGEISIDVYIVGKSACGDLVGVKTTSIET
jgi:hypothetical protein